MFKDALQQVLGADRYAIASLLIFLGAFVSVVIWVIRLDRRHLDHMSRLPLEPDATGATNKETIHG